LPRAYFVNQVAKKSGLEIINMVKNTQFDPSFIAFTEEEVAGTRHLTVLLMFESKSLMMNLFSLMLMPAETTSIFRRYLYDGRD